MHLKTYLDKFDNLKAENRLLKFAVAVIGAGCVVSSVLSIMAVRHQKVILLPPAVDKRIVVHGSSVSPEYIELFSKYALGLFFNYTPEVFDDQIDDLLKLATPRYHSALKRETLTMKDNVKQLAITSVFYPKILRVNEKQQEIRIVGLLIQTAQGQEVERDEKIYRLKYQLINGRFYVDAIEEVLQG